MPENNPPVEDEKKAKQKTSRLLSNFQAARDKWRTFQKKVQPYQSTINKVRIVLYAIAVPWAVFIAVKSLPYYAAIGKGESYFKQGLYAEAEREFLFCYEQCQTENAKDPRMARVLNNLGMLYRGTGRYRLAAPYVKETVEIAQKYFPKRQELPVSLSNEGALLNDEGLYSEAEKVYRQAIQAWRDNVRKDSDSKLASIYNGLARSLREQGKLDEAMLTAQKALAMKERESGKNSVDGAAVLENLGKISQQKGDFAGAQNYLDCALSIDLKAYGQKHPDVASDQCSLGRLYTEQGKWKEARLALAQSLATRQFFFKSEHPTVARTICSLGELDWKEGNREAAIQNLTQALRVQTKFLGAQHPDTLETAQALKQAQAAKLPEKK